MSKKIREWGITSYTDRFKLIHIDSSEGECLLEGHIDDDDASLIVAAPGLLSVLESFDITGPDDDGLFWIVIHKGNEAASCIINLGALNEYFAKIVAEFQRQQQYAVAKAKGEQG